MSEQPLKLFSFLMGISELVGAPISKEMLKRFLKKQGYTYRRIRKSLRKTPDPIDVGKPKISHLASARKLASGVMFLV